MLNRYLINKYFRYSLMALGGRLKRRQALTGPRKVIIGVTDFCNYQCVMCREHSYAAPEIFRKKGAGLPREQQIFTEMKKMDFNVYCRLIDDLKALGVINVNLSGKGEPLSHEKIIPMINYAVNNGLQTELTTNASLLDAKKAYFMVTRGVKSVHCSINAGSAQTYSKITGIRNLGLFDRVRENVQRLVKIKKAMGRSRPRIMLSFVLTSQNFFEVEAAGRLAIETGAERISFVPVSIYYANTSFLKLSPRKKKALFVSFKFLKPMLNRHGVYHNIDETITGLRGGGDGMDTMESFYSHFPCYVGWYFAMVFANGTVLPCCQCLKTMGNINEHGFNEIWKNPVYQKFRLASSHLPDHGKSLPGCLCSECSFDNYNLLFHKVIHPLHKIRYGKKDFGTLSMIRKYLKK